jgi:hypothetical protein
MGYRLPLSIQGYSPLTYWSSSRITAADQITALLFVNDIKMEFENGQVILNIT